MLYVDRSQNPLLKSWKLEKKIISQFRQIFNACLLKLQHILQYDAIHRQFAESAVEELKVWKKKIISQFRQIFNACLLKRQCHQQEDYKRRSFAEYDTKIWKLKNNFSFL